MYFLLLLLYIFCVYIYHEVNKVPFKMGDNILLLSEKINEKNQGRQCADANFRPLNCIFSYENVVEHSFSWHLARSCVCVTRDSRQNGVKITVQSSCFGLLDRHTTLFPDNNVRPVL